MQITRIANAKPYAAPKHFDMRALRLQGLDASASDFAAMGLSHFLPGGGAEMDAGKNGKLYFMVDGELTIELASGEREVLRKWDSCFIAAGEARAVLNTTNAVATLLVVTPLAQKP
jgi:glyoxylate utilization-related uncharacterized protein